MVALGNTVARSQRMNRLRRLSRGGVGICRRMMGVCSNESLLDSIR